MTEEPIHEFELEDQKPSRHAFELVGLLTCVLAAAFGILLRIVYVFWLSDPLWLDELHTAWSVSGSFVEVASRAMAGNQSPLFFWFEYLTNFGERLDASLLRTPIFACGIALIGSTTYITRKITCDWICVACSIVVVSFDNEFIFYGTEARPYCAVQLMAVWHFYFFWSCVLSNNRSNQKRIGFVATGVAMFYFHYTSLMLIAAEVVWVLASRLFQSTASRLDSDESRSNPSNTASFSAALFMLGLIIIVCIPGIWHLLIIGGEKERWSSFANAASFLKQLQPLWLAYILIPGIVISACWLLQSFSSRKFKIVSYTNSGLLPVCLLILMPIGAATVLSSNLLSENVNGFASLGHVRYVVGSITLVPIAAALLANGFYHPRAKLAYATAFIVAASCLSPLFQDWLKHGQLQPLRIERWDLVASEINLPANNGYMVFTCSNLIEDQELANVDQMASDQATSLFQYCRYPLDNKIFRIRNSNDRLHPLPTFAESRLRAEHLARLSRAPGVFVVIRGDEQLVNQIYSEFKFRIDECRRTVVLERWQRPEGNSLAWIQFEFEAID